MARREATDEEREIEWERRRRIYRELVPLADGHIAPVIELPKTGAWRSIHLGDFQPGGRLAHLRAYLPLAWAKCDICKGIGIRFGYRATLCACVLRRVTRSLVARYRLNQTEGYISNSCTPSVTLSGKDSRLSWGRKNQEFCADLWLLAKRELDEDGWKVFRLHSLEGREWRAGRGMNRGTWFHTVYANERILGAAAIELKPYPLFPLESYFAGNGHMIAPGSVPFRSARKAPH